MHRLIRCVGPYFAANRRGGAINMPLIGARWSAVLHDELAVDLLGQDDRLAAARLVIFDIYVGRSLAE